MTELEIQQKIDHAVLSRPDMAQSSRVELRMSAVGDCPRLLDYKLQHGRSEASLASAMRLLTGEPIHEFYRRTLADAFGDDFQMAEAEISFDIGIGSPIVGHCDGLLNSLGYIVEVKTVGEATYSLVKTRGAPLSQHLDQGNFYCGSLNQKAILFIYHNRNSGEYLTYVVPFSKETFDRTVEKLRAAREREARKVMIDRPYHNPTESPCFYCDFKTECYKNFDGEIASGDTRPAEGVLLEKIRSFLSMRKERLAVSKAEDQAKSEIMSSMIANKLKAVTADSFKLELSVGKNNNPLLKIGGE